MQINTRQLRAFLLVARHRNFSRAAEALSVTQSGLSVLVRDLETQVGFRLFDRTTREVSLTSYGAEFHAIAERTLADLESSINRIARQASSDRQTLRIGATQLMSAYVMPAAIAEFNAQSEGVVQARLIDGDRATLCPMVEEGKLDMAVGVFLRPGPGVHGAPLFNGSFAAVRAGRPSRTRRTLRWADLIHETLIMLPDNNPIQQLVRGQIGQTGDRENDLFFNHIETQIAVAEAGSGVAIIPSFALAACDRRHLLVHDVVEPVIPLEVYQIWSGDAEPRPDVARFSRFLRHYIETNWAP